jgi:hypothetical protein
MHAFWPANSTRPAVFTSLPTVCTWVSQIHAQLLLVENASHDLFTQVIRCKQTARVSCHRSEQHNALAVTSQE